MSSSRKNVSRKNSSRKNSSRKDSSRKDSSRKDSRKSASRKNGVTRRNKDSFVGGAVKVGSKAQVFHGTAEKTAGGLKKDDLMQNKHGRIVSRKKHEAGKKALKHLREKGYVAKKGEFKLFSKKASRKNKTGGW